VRYRLFITTACVSVLAGAFVFELFLVASSLPLDRGVYKVQPDQLQRNPQSAHVDEQAANADEADELFVRSQAR
jgi:hypothetical protein